ncbi:MAG: hypothetical protein BWZ04_01339 [Firmicutes bacterium ADurb.BinA205]|nr:MAG: hypothetical protein BWZ04_01339 [Firmicutes bacterium ADurb.BinA205]
MNNISYNNPNIRAQQFAHSSARPRLPSLLSRITCQWSEVFRRAIKQPSRNKGKYKKAAVRSTHKGWLNMIKQKLVRICARRTRRRIKQLLRAHLRLYPRPPDETGSTSGAVLGWTA